MSRWRHIRNFLSWFLSIILHAALILALVQTVHLAPLELKEIMEVDLTEMEIPDKVAPLPVPQEVPPIEPDAPAVAAPLPMDKTVVFDDSPPEIVPQAESIPEPEPEPAPDIVEISPVKTKEPVEEAKPDRIMVRKGDFIASRGHEARFGRTLMGDYYSYSAKELDRKSVV